TYKWDIKTTNINDPSNYAYKLYQDVKPTFYKFKKGKFKKYFIFFTNCVLLADQIIGATGTDILKVNGVITPGTYYDYLEKLFNKKDSIVVKRTIYMPK
ncbi:MAG: MFS transporter, partial [Bacilli bacterium]